MTEATRATDVPTRTTPPAWFNLSAIVDDETCTEVAAVADEAEALIDVVRELSIRAFRANAVVESACKKADKVEDLTDEYSISDGLYRLSRIFSGADRLDDALRTLVDNLQVARGEGPTGSSANGLEWLAAERERAGVEWPVTWEETEERIAERAAAMAAAE